MVVEYRLRERTALYWHEGSMQVGVALYNIRHAAYLRTWLTFDEDGLRVYLVTKR